MLVPSLPTPSVTKSCIAGVIFVLAINLLASHSLLFGGLTSVDAEPGWVLSLSRRLLIPGKPRQHRVISSVDLSPEGICQHAAHLRNAIDRLHSRRAQLLFHHVQKCGGTTMCHLATFNQHRIWSCKENKTLVSGAFGRGNNDIMDCNCNGPYRDFAAFAIFTPQQQKELLRNFSDATTFFSEAPVAAEMLLDGSLVHVTVLRHPVSRYLSHMMHALAVHQPALYNRTLQYEDPSPVLLQVLADPNFEVKDDLLTRMYGGTPVEALPPHKLHQQHLQRAIDNLDNYDAVFVLEELPKAPAQGALRWIMNFHANFTGYRSGTNYSSFKLEHKIRPDVLQRLQSQMQLDLQLYKHAKLLHRRTVSAWQAVASAAQLPDAHGLRQHGLGADGKGAVAQEGRSLQRSIACPQLVERQGVRAVAHSA